MNKAFFLCPLTFFCLWATAADVMTLGSDTAALIQGASPQARVIAPLSSEPALAKPTRVFVALSPELPEALMRDFAHHCARIVDARTHCEVVIGGIRVDLPQSVQNEDGSLTVTSAQKEKMNREIRRTMTKMAEICAPLGGRVVVDGPFLKRYAIEKLPTVVVGSDAVVPTFTAKVEPAATLTDAIDLIKRHKLTTSSFGAVKDSLAATYGRLQN